MEILESTDKDETEDAPSKNAESQHSSSIDSEAHKLLQLDRDDFQTLVVCPKCDTTYKKQDCLNGTRIKLCSYVEFFLHPWANK